MITGEIDEKTKEISIEFVPVDEKEFQEIEVDVSQIDSIENLIEHINETQIPSNRYVKIVLVGDRKIEIEPSAILKFLLNPNIIKIKDKTTLELNLEEIAKQNSLKGIFVRTLLEKQEKEPDNKQKIERAIEIGLASFN